MLRLTIISQALFLWALQLLLSYQLFTDDLIYLLDNSEKMLMVMGGGTSWVLEHVAVRALVVKDNHVLETEAIES